MTAHGAKAPAKLILSGEHAVLHGAPAIATAVNRFCHIQIVSHPSRQPGLSLHTPSWEQAMSLDLKAMNQIHQAWTLQERKPQTKMAVKEFISLTVSIFLERFQQSLTEHLCVNIQSDIPIGSGLGSSAACICSLLSALAKHFGREIDPASLLAVAIQCENFQHGQSSGLDIKASLMGGCRYYHEGNHVLLPLNTPLYLIYTGQPISNTAECTRLTQKLLSNDHHLLDAFTQITKSLRDELLTPKPKTDVIHELVAHNHQLLSRLGVVSQKVNAMITEIENAGGAAKISGAGSIRGDASGMVWCLGNPLALQAIAAQYEYPFFILNPCEQGVTYD